MKRIRLVVVVAIGCAILLAVFGIGWADWWQLPNRIGIVQILMAALGVIVALLVAMGILNKDRERWIALILVAVLLLGFSALTIASTGLITAPIGLLLLGFSIRRLVHHHIVHKVC